MEVEGALGLGLGCISFGSRGEIKGRPWEQEKRGSVRLWDGVEVDSNCGGVHVLSKSCNARCPSPRRRCKQSYFSRDCRGFMQRVMIGSFWGRRRGTRGTSLLLAGLRSSGSRKWIDCHSIPTANLDKYNIHLPFELCAFKWVPTASCGAGVNFRTRPLTEMFDHFWTCAIRIKVTPRPCYVLPIGTCGLTCAGECGSLLLWQG